MALHEAAPVADGAVGWQSVRHAVADQAAHVHRVGVDVQGLRVDAVEVEHVHHFLLAQVRENGVLQALEAFHAALQVGLRGGGQQLTSYLAHLLLAEERAQAAQM